MLGDGVGGYAFDPEIFSNLMSCLLTAIYSIVSHWRYPPPSPSTSGSAASRESSPVSSPATAHSSPITTPKRSSLGPLLGQTRGHGVPSTPPVVTIAPTKTSNGLWRADKRQVGHTSASFVVSLSLSLSLFSQQMLLFLCSSFQLLHLLKNTLLYSSIINVGRFQSQFYPSVITIGKKRSPFIWMGNLLQEIRCKDK